MEKMSMNEAAFRLMARAQKPMHYRDLMDTMLRRRMILTSGKTPEQSLLTGMRNEISRNGKRARFRAMGAGMYRLSRHGKRLAKLPGSR